MTATEIAEKYNTKVCTVRNMLHKFHINRKEDPRRISIDKDLLYQLFVIDKKSVIEIQKLTGYCE